MCEMSDIFSDINQNCNYVKNVWWVTAVIISQKKSVRYVTIDVAKLIWKLGQLSLSHSS
jgi:hypothetical protein